MAANNGFTIRPAKPSDMDALYAICLATGDSGEDAKGLHSDPRLIGHVYAGPYAVLEPELALVAEDGGGIAGYVLGTADTARFEDRLEREWWPALRTQYANPAESDAATWSPDQRLAAEIHRPGRTPRSVTRRFPAHLHLDLLPRMRGKGAATALLQACYARMKQSGVKAVMIGASRANDRGVRFWQRSGFVEIDSPDLDPTKAIWMGRAI